MGSLTTVNTMGTALVTVCAALRAEVPTV